MNPIIIEKNMAIAEMLGYKFFSKWLTLGRSEGQPQVELPNYIDIFDELMQAPSLRFHTDANWQFEALTQINKSGYEYEICSYLPNNQRYWCAINLLIDEETNSLETIISPIEGDTVKEAIFECIYAFSQYLKNKTDVVH